MSGLSETFAAWPVLAAFFAASLVLAVTPGPAVLYIVTRTLAQGRRAGLVSVAGVALGNFGNALGASLGLAALFAVSSAAFSVVKLAGAAYLIYLGVRTLTARDPAVSAPDAPAPDTRRVFRDAAVVALLNPKTAMFFAAFLPQFVDPHGSAIVQTVVLGATFVAIAACTDSAYALAAGYVAPRLSRSMGTQSAARYATATAFIGLGAYAAVSGARAVK